MASTPPENEAFLREVDDELRRDELKGFWKRWGRWLIGGIVGGLALFAGYLWWESAKAAKAGADGETLAKALETLSSSDTPEAEAQLKSLTTAKNPGYRASAKLALAALALQRGKPDVRPFRWPFYPALRESASQRSPLGCHRALGCKFA